MGVYRILHGIRVGVTALIDLSIVNHVSPRSVDFAPPRNRHYPMTVAYCEAGSTLTDTAGGNLGYFWKAFLRGNDVCLQREDLDDVHVMFDARGITQIDLAFDQTMRPFFCYVKDGSPYYYHFEKETSAYAEVALPVDIKTPRCALDLPLSIPLSDIYILYSRGTGLYYRIQRERFTKEHLIAKIANKSMVWRIGRTKSGAFGYHWR